MQFFAWVVSLPFADHRLGLFLAEHLAEQRLVLADDRHLEIACASSKT
jgi:hypothetical protein